MGKTFGILMIVGLVWVGLEVYTEGTHGAFGGIFASFIGAEAPSEEETLSTPRRAGRAMQRAHEERGERFDRVYDQAQ